MLKDLEDLERLFKLMNTFDVAQVEIPSHDGTGAFKVTMAFAVEAEEDAPGVSMTNIGFDARSEDEEDDFSDPSPDDRAIKSPYEHPALPVRAPFPGQPAGFTRK